MSTAAPTSNATQYRYGTWHSETCTLSETTPPVNWRQTPRSKKYMAVAPTLAIPLAIEVISCAPNTYDLSLPDVSINHLQRWCNCPDASVRPFTVTDGKVVRMQGPCGVQDQSYAYCDAKLCAGQWILGRVRPYIQSIGSNQHKMQLCLVDAVIL